MQKNFLGTPKLGFPKKQGSAAGLIALGNATEY